MRGRDVASSVAAAAVLLACRVSAFSCADGSDCAGLPGGVCEPEGYCSFPDDACASGQRFGEYSGALSNDCVPVHDDTVTDASSSSPSEGVLTEIGMSTATSTAASSDDTAAIVTETEEPPDTLTSTTSPETSGSSSGGMIDPDLALWFTFEEEGSEGILNSGVLGGAAACTDETCPASVRGMLGAAGSFDGVDDCGIIGEGNLLSGDAEFTVATWLFLDALPNGTSVILGQPFGTELLNTWDIALVGNGFSATLVYEGILDVEGGNVASIEFDIVNVGAWVHVAATHSGEQIALWIDGEIVSQTTGFSLIGDGQPLLLGCDDDHTGDYVLHVEAVLDDVRLYQRVLEADEIAALAAP